MYTTTLPQKEKHTSENTCLFFVLCGGVLQPSIYFHPIKSSSHVTLGRACIIANLPPGDNAMKAPLIP